MVQTAVGDTADHERPAQSGVRGAAGSSSFTAFERGLASGVATRLSPIPRAPCHGGRTDHLRAGEARLGAVSHWAGIAATDAVKSARNKPSGLAIRGKILLSPVSMGGEGSRSFPRGGAHEPTGCRLAVPASCALTLSSLPRLRGRQRSRRHARPRPSRRRCGHARADPDGHPGTDADRDPGTDAHRDPGADADRNAGADAHRDPGADADRNACADAQPQRLRRRPPQRLRRRPPQRLRRRPPQRLRRRPPIGSGRRTVRSMA